MSSSDSTQVFNNFLQTIQDLNQNIPNYSQADLTKAYQALLTFFINIDSKKVEIPQDQATQYQEYRSKIMNQLSFLQNQLQNNIQSYSSDIKQSKEQLDQYNNNITFTAQNIMDQQSELEDNSQILNTRNRMLQISREKNVYKKKMIYTLLSILFVLVMILFVLYMSFQGGKGIQPVSNVIKNIKP